MMRWRMMGSTCVLIGTLIAMMWVSALPAPSAMAAPLLQPSPRPPVTKPERKDGKKTSDAPLGHVMGTVINTSTNAPAAGVPVNVDGTIVTTDANGNYDAYVPAGEHTVVLAIAPDEGVLITPPQTVVVEADKATILHLSYSTGGAAAPAPAAPMATAEAQPVSAPTDSAGAAPVELPQQLPNTGGPSAAKQQTQARSAAAPPRLPRTAGEEAQVSLAWPLGAVMLIMLGGLILVQPRWLVLVARTISMRRRK